MGRIEALGGDFERGRDVRENENALSSHNEDDFRLRVDSFLAQVSYGNREEFRERRRGICERSRVGAVSSGVLRSRPLPNIFAFALTTFALSLWLEERRGLRINSSVLDTLAIMVVSMVVAVFRCDNILLLAPLGIHVASLFRMTDIYVREFADYRTLWRW